MIDDKVKERMLKQVEVNSTADMSDGKKDSLILDKKCFGPFWKYVEDDNITDVDFNGEDLWITDAQNRRFQIHNHGITKEFVGEFSQRVANQVSKPFNKKDNLLEAETKTLRISILHESAAVSGRSICLRKSLPMVRLTSKNMVVDNYIPRPVLNLLVNCITAKMNFVIGGEPAAGKTEFAKYITRFIPNSERVITIEDSPEWHFKEINPGHDCIEMRVNPDFGYDKAIKTCLRQNPKWIMLSEARSVEVKHLIEAWSTGVCGVTTIHTDDVRKIPSRLLNMMPNRDDADRLENDIYDFVNIGMLIRKKEQLDGTLRRYVDQVAIFYRDKYKENCVHMLVKNGELVDDALPKDIVFRLGRIDCVRPFECGFVDNEIGKAFTYHTLAEQKELEEQRLAEEKRLAAEQERLAAEAAERKRQEQMTIVKPKPMVQVNGAVKSGTELQKRTLKSPVSHTVMQKHL